MNYKTNLIFVVMALASNSFACGNNSTNNNPTTDVTPDQKDETVDVDMGIDVEADEMSCEPLTMCPANACGEIDDNCGSTLDCGSCDCTPGTASKGNCGPCGLGALTCAANNTGEGTCDLPANFPSEQEVSCDRYVFAKPMNTSGGAGTKDDPYPTFSKALENAQAPAIIILASGAFLENRSVSLVDGVHVFGEFDDSTWTFGSINGLSRVQVTDNSSNRVVGLDANSITSRTILSHVAVDVSSTEDEQSLYGMRVRSSPGLVLQNVSALTFSAGNGVNGTNGPLGADGIDADTQISALSLSTSRIDPDAPQSSDCPRAEGGRGGRGARFEGGLVFNPEVGSSSSLATEGGLSGMTANDQGGNGSNGANGDDGADGVGGLAVVQLDNDFFDPSVGNGSSGFSGDPGAGGGGGGGGWWLKTGAFPIGEDGYAGSAGGHGGSGGCQGAGGLGGTAGGFSVGLLVLNTPMLSISDSKFSAGPGGSGGNGGVGGRGGLKGQGGVSTDEYIFQGNPLGRDQNGGTGGAGGVGGKGGAGGGGAGGSSYGVFCEASTLNTQGTVEFEVTATARGGSSASSNLNAGGAEGVAIERACQ